MRDAGTLSGRYELGDKLGSGGMSNVYRATDLILERTVAVKILAEHLSRRRTPFVERFPPRGAGRRQADPPQHRPGLRQPASTKAATTSLWSTFEGRSGAQILQAPGSVRARENRRRGPGSRPARASTTAHRRGIIHRDGQARQT